MNQPVHSNHPSGAPGYSHGEGFSIVWDEAHGGARPETVLHAVLERVQFLQEQLPCDENTHILTALHEVLHWEQVRNERRIAQGVQGTEQAHVSEDASEDNSEEEEEEEIETAQHPVHPTMPEELAVEEHPHPLDIAIPQQDGRYLPQAVLRSIEEQNIPYRIWISTKFSNGEFADARNNVKDMALQGSSPYVLMTDNDIVFQPGDFEAMILWLEHNPDFGMIGISKHGDPAPSEPNSVVEPTHVDAGPCMFRRDVFEKFEYSNDIPTGTTCECAAMCYTLRNDLGVRCGFLTGRFVRHIQNTRLDS